MEAHGLQHDAPHRQPRPRREADMVVIDWDKAYREFIETEKAYADMDAEVYRSRTIPHGPEEDVAEYWEGMRKWARP